MVIQWSLPSARFFEAIHMSLPAHLKIHKLFDGDYTASVIWTLTGLDAQKSDFAYDP